MCAHLALGGGTISDGDHFLVFGATLQLSKSDAPNVRLSFVVQLVSALSIAVISYRPVAGYQLYSVGSRSSHIASFMSSAVT